MQQTDSLVKDKKNIYDRAPVMGRGFKFISMNLDRLFGRLYDWRLNPFASSGTFSVVLLVILVVTGLYLILIYRLGAPYQSVVDIQSQVWGGRWVRAMHRYATDLSLIFIVFHIFRMFSQGKTWGPRLLAWVSGCVMLGMFSLSAYTGYILVWDRFALSLAKNGAHLVDLISILPNPLSRAFSGDVSLGNSFYFMNLFLHVAIPLGLFAALWAHTAKLSNPKWFPKKSIWIGVTTALFLLAISFPIKMESSANVLEVQGRMVEDLWFSWWLPIKEQLGEVNFLIFVFAVVGLFFSAPFLWRPKKEMAPQASQHDEASCEGCEQCVTDCPYEAISMVPRTIGEGSPMVANVNSIDCVSCGICSASCSQFSIGPVGRSGRDQLRQIKNLEVSENKIPLYLCKNRASSLAMKDQYEPVLVDCVGNIHTGVLTAALHANASVAMAPCDPECCEMRYGSQLELERIYESREPGLPGRIDLKRIQWLQNKPSQGWLPGLRIFAVTSVLLWCVAYLSNFERGHVGSDAYLRLSWRFPLQKVQECRTVTAEEKSKRPIHMQVDSECVNHAISYLLVVFVDGIEVLNKAVQSPGFKSDRPLLVDAELPVSPGKHTVKLTFVPNHSVELDTAQAPKLVQVIKADFVAGIARLVKLQDDKKGFELK